MILGFRWWRSGEPRARASKGSCRFLLPQTQRPSFSERLVPKAGAGGDTYAPPPLSFPRMGYPSSGEDPRWRTKLKFAHKFSPGNWWLVIAGLMKFFIVVITYNLYSISCTEIFFYSYKSGIASVNAQAYELLQNTITSRYKLSLGHKNRCY